MKDQAFILWLKKQHEEIMDCEKKAYECLDAGDKAGYSVHMHEKAEKLKDLDRLSRPFLKDLDSGERAEVMESLARFSEGAATALSLDSLFYMSALLYPDDHREGDPDNLQKLIMRLEK